jgi:hypothetical protein
MPVPEGWWELRPCLNQWSGSPINLGCLPAVRSRWFPRAGVVPRYPELRRIRSCIVARGISRFRRGHAGAIDRDARQSEVGMRGILDPPPWLAAWGFTGMTEGTRRAASWANSPQPSSHRGGLPNCSTKSWMSRIVLRSAWVERSPKYRECSGGRQGAVRTASGRGSPRAD